MTRLQKIIADSGYCSRRKAEAYIEAGQVRVNGRPAKLGDKAIPGKDIITVCNVKLSTAKAKLRYIKMYKPRGYLCTISDPHAGSKRLITDLLKSVSERVYPVGRLDANSEGLILLTNDGAFANNVMHPSNCVKKSYRVTVPEQVNESHLERLSSGVDIGKDGLSEITQPCMADILTAENKRTVLLITISEGKNRQVRRMCEAVGLTVTKLKRISIAGIKLGMLKPGEYAELTKQELSSLGVSK